MPIVPKKPVPAKSSRPATPAPSQDSFVAPAMDRYQTAAQLIETELRGFKVGDRVDRSAVLKKVPENVLAKNDAQVFLGFIIRAAGDRFRVEKGVNGGTFIVR